MTDPRLRVIQRSEGADEAAILDVLDGRTIVVRMPGGQPSWRHQVLGLTLADLLGRVFTRIQVDIDAAAAADPALGPGPASLADRFAQVRAHGVEPAEPAEPSLTIAVGPAEWEAELHIDGAGWQSYLGTGPSRLATGDGSMVPIGPLLAAARGAAHAFTFLMSGLGVRHQPPVSIYSSVLDYRAAAVPLSDEPALPDAFGLDAVQVGAGSIGGAADYAFALTSGLTGRLEIVDPQALEAGNAYRAILAPRAAAEAERGKAAVAEEAFANHAVQAAGYRKSVQDWLAGRPRELPLPLVLCAVDSPESRRVIQDCLPRDMINAACHPTEVTVSAHRTGKGPCVCCLQMPDVLNSERIKAKLIAAATGFNFGMVVGLMIKAAPLTELHLRGIERHNGMPAGALQDYLGATLEQLYDRRLLYGATPVETEGGGIVAVAAPWVTALAGFLLAAETLKYAGGEAYADLRLGHGGPIGVKVEEAVYASPEHRLLTRPARWAGSECLCRSPRRARIITRRYKLKSDDFDL